MWQLHLHLIPKNINIVFSINKRTMYAITLNINLISPMNMKSVQYLYEPVLI